MVIRLARSSTCIKVAITDSARNGERPASSSYRMAPREYTSAAVVTALWARACSGAR
jgi:hypothetical protein